MAYLVFADDEIVSLTKPCNDCLPSSVMLCVRFVSG